MFQRKAGRHIISYDLPSHRCLHVCGWSPRRWFLCIETLALAAAVSCQLVAVYYCASIKYPTIMFHPDPTVQGAGSSGVILAGGTLLSVGYLHFVHTLPMTIKSS